MKKQKILFLSQCFPLPADGGGKIKTFNTLQTLSQSYDIFAVFISERKPSQEDLRVLRRLGISVKIFYTDIMSRDIKENYLKLLWNYVRLIPHYVYQYYYPPAITFVQGKIISWQPNVIHVDHINTSQFLPSNRWLRRYCQRRPRLILENHNLNHRLFFTRFHETKKLIRKLYLLIEGGLNWWYGECHYPQFDHIFSISSGETRYLQQKYNSVSTQPLVYPLHAVRQMQQKKYDILFVGYLEWPPNEVAVRWFISEVLPLIVEKIPDVQFHVVGKMSRRLMDLSQNRNVNFHGYQRDITAFLVAAKLMVVPFHTGAGIRIKALTALQNGIPMVSTSLGVADLGLLNGKEYVEANMPNDFAIATIELLQNTSRRDSMSRAERNYFKHHYDENKNTMFLKDYTHVVECTN